MASNAKKYGRVAALAVGFLLSTLPVTAHPGVISGMIAKRRSERQFKAQAMSSSMQGRSLTGESGSMTPAEHSGFLRNHFGLPSAGESGSLSMAGRFKKRFSLKGKGQGMTTSSPFSSDRDENLSKTSR